MQTIATFDTRFPADTLQWCPIPWGKEKDTWILATGTYQLVEEIPTSPIKSLSTNFIDSNQSTAVIRQGSIHLHTFRENKDKYGRTDARQQSQLRCIAHQEQPLLIRDATSSPSSISAIPTRILSAGVLHIEWNRSAINHVPQLFVATSMGSVQVYSLIMMEEEDIEISSLEELPARLTEVITFHLKGDNGVESNAKDSSSRQRLCLYVNANPKTPDQLVASDNLGNLHVMSMSNVSQQEEQYHDHDGNRDSYDVRSWKAHDAEIWVTCWDSSDPFRLYSGADDSILKIWDIRAPPTNALARINWHQAGVTALEHHPFRDYLFASGSYDEYVCVWDKRYLRKPIIEHRITGGGIWSIRWHPRDASRMLLSCMHEGFHILSMNVTEEELPSATDREIVQDLFHYREHTSLAYGGDWFPGSTSDFSIMATCSFYDHQLHLWSYDASAK
jgi:WD40 repeat protein